jgi:hypothetical protein
MAQNINNEHNSSRHVELNTPMPTHNSWKPRTNCLMRARRCVIEDAVERNSWGKSGCEWMCRFPNTGGLNGTLGNVPLETHNLTHHNPWQPRTNCRMCAERSVKKDTVEPNSWGKSECEWMCHIPNTKGLYHTSVDAPLEIHNLTHDTTWQPRSNCGIFAGRSIVEDALECNTHPPWCHVTKSNSPSSRRTQVAANAYKEKPHKFARSTTKHKRGVNADRKWYKQIEFLKDVQVCNVASNRRVQYMSLDNIRKNIIVCDGGDTTSNAIKIHWLLKVFTIFEYVMVTYG